MQGIKENRANYYTDIYRLIPINHKKQQDEVKNEPDQAIGQDR